MLSEAERAEIVALVLRTQEKRDTFSRLPQAMEITGQGRSTLLAKVAGGTFPPPVKIKGEGRMSCWITSELYDWVAEQIAAHRSEAT